MSRCRIVAARRLETILAAIIILFSVAPLRVDWLWAATFAVTNVNDSGAGSFRQAITDANASPGLDTISFQISGSGVRTITPVSLLPPVSDPVVIDGTTQPGFAGQPLIELNGLTATGSVAGLRILAGNSTVRGLAINRFNGDAIRLEVYGTNRIVGNYLGTDPSGTQPRPNVWEGVFINGVWGNTVGGTNAADRNVIACNGDSGVYILNAGDNTVEGNFIGLAAAGDTALGNSSYGVVVYNSQSNRIGGSTAGSRNLLSGNGASGIALAATGATRNLVQGNYIGTSVTGGFGVSNASDGITLVAGAAGNLIGGTNSGEGNLISGNGKAGIALIGAATANNAIQGNRVGSDLTGRLPLPNSAVGVWVDGAASNVVGGVTADARNLISGNRQHGVYILTNSYGNLVSGNYIGVDATGTNALANGYNGVTIASASGNTVGGSLPAARNIISGNSFYGVQILGGASSNSLLGNYVGTDAAGGKALGNVRSGIRIESPGNNVGGSSPASGNVVSANLDFGILLLGTAATNNVIQGNFLGTTASGSAGLGNHTAGIGLSGACFNLIGGTAGGAGNLISANFDAGVYADAGSFGNQILGNTIGPDSSGTAPLGNRFEGIYLADCPSNTIGGVAPGAGNLISANLTRGIFLTNSPWTVIQGNRIGTARDGFSPLANAFHNIECAAGASYATIGGGISAGNIIAWSQGIYAGVRVRDGAAQNVILGNSIFNNAALGIDLGAAGPNLNDPCDADAGANSLQNFPDLEQAVSGQAVAIRGRLDSAPNTTYRLQFFASSVADPSGYGEGQTFLGEITLPAGSACTNSFKAQFAAAVPAGYVITATATDPANNTSEFSRAIPVYPAPALAISTPVAGQILLAWPTNLSSGFVLNQTASLSPPVAWTPVTNRASLGPGVWSVAVPFNSANTFYSLRFE